MEELTYDEIVAKLRRGEELDEYEIRTIVWRSHQVYEMEGEEHRWHREMFTVIDLDGELWTSMRQVVAGHPDVPVDVYTTGGTLLRQAVPAKDALQGLPAGVYVVNGKKVIR